MAKNTSLCKYFLIGCPRPVGECHFEHEPSRLTIRWCPYKERCFYDRTKYKKTKICHMFHPHEKPSQDEIISRSLEYCQPVRPEDVFRHTKMCTSEKCQDKECINAHQPSELKPAMCPYKNHCAGPEHCKFMHKPKSSHWGSESDEEPDFDKPLTFT